MSETVAPFELTIDVQPADIDELGHVNNIVYLRWVQQVATAHWTSAATAEEQASLLWVVARHEIDYLKPAFAGDTLIAKTWVGEASRIRFDRHTELRRSNDGTILARARTVWCPIDPATGRVTNPAPSVRARFSKA